MIRQLLGVVVARRAAFSQHRLTGSCHSFPVSTDDTLHRSVIWRAVANVASDENLPNKMRLQHILFITSKTEFYHFRSCFRIDEGSHGGEEGPEE